MPVRSNCLKTSVLTVLCLLSVSCGVGRPVQGGDDDLFSESHIISVMKRVADWQLAHLNTVTELSDGGTEPVPNNGWIRGAFFTGVMAAYRTTDDPKYLETALRWAEANEWQPGPRPRHADDHTVGQVYAELYAIRPEARMIEPLRERFDLMISDPAYGPESGWSKNKNWSWADALFMAPPVLARLHRITGERKYLDLMDRMWWDTVDYLYDADDHLFYRDERYKINPDGTGPRTAHGQKVFWGRGNGWVIGGLVRVLEYLPKDHPEYGRYVRLYKEMSERIADLQGEDGLWRASLLDPEEFPAPETSGSAFFTYALTWGVNNGILNAGRYEPIVRRAWVGLNGAVESDGRLGWVQKVGHEPRAVTRGDSMEYGAGAFLLAASEVYEMVQG